MQLFTDGSVHPPSGIGYGAYLAVTPSGTIQEVQLRRFENTNSSQLEIKTLLWALRELEPEAVTIYTDSQTIVGLPDRRARLEKQAYRSRQQKPIKHADLYREFFHVTDQIDCTFVKVKGHRASLHKSAIDHLFSLVDRAARKALRDARISH